MNIDKLIDSDNPQILKQTLSLLQNFFLSPNLSDEESLDVVSHLLKISINHLEPSFSLSEHISSANPKSLAFLQSPVDIHELMIKLHYLKINYPSSTQVPELMKHMTVDYYSYFEQKGRINAYKGVVSHVHAVSVNDSVDKKVLSVFPDVISKYVDLFYKEKNIKEHPLVGIYKGLEKEINKLTLLPDQLDGLFNYWSKNSQYFNTYLSIENLSHKYSDLCSFNPLENEINLMHLGKIKVFAERCAEKLYIHFINHPQIQCKLDNRFPNYFQFFEWLNPEVFKVLNASMSKPHLDVLATYKKVDGYNFYVKSMFSIAPPSTSTISLKESDFKKLERVLIKPVNWDVLFSDPDTTQPSNETHPLPESLFELVNKQFNEYKSPNLEMDEKFRQLIIEYKNRIIN